MKHREKTERLLVSLYLAAKAENWSGYFNLGPIADSIGLERNEGELRAIAHTLEDKGYVAASFTTGADEASFSVRLVSFGIETAEDLLDDRPDFANAIDHVPAADRYVSLTHNQRSDIVNDLAGLREAIEQSNQGSPEEREIALSEVAAFEQSIVQPRVSAELIERFTNRVLVWIGARFAGVVFDAAALCLATRLLPLLAAG